MKSPSLELKLWRSSLIIWIFCLLKTLKMNSWRRWWKLLKLIMKKFNCDWQKYLVKLFFSFSHLIFIWSTKSQYLSFIRWWSAIRKSKFGAKPFLTSLASISFIRIKTFRTNMILTSMSSICDLQKKMTHKFKRQSLPASMKPLRCLPMIRTPKS